MPSRKQVDDPSRICSEKSGRISYRHRFMQIMYLCGRRLQATKVLIVLGAFSQISYPSLPGGAFDDMIQELQLFGQIPSTPC